MNCFDCAIEDRSEPAVAVCTDCGAAVCLTHAHVTRRWLTTTMAINRTVPVQPPARALRCATCQAAHEAQQATIYATAG